MIVASELKTFKISNGALKGAALPSRLKVLGWGSNDSTDGPFRVGDKTLAQLSANQKAGYERVAIDFDHCSVAGTETNKALMAAGQPPLIFGYGDVAMKTGDGIYLENITWTPLGQQHARNFEDISPALRDDNREVTFIHSVALTPNGKVTGLQFFSVNQPTNTMELKPENVLLISELAPAIGLAATASKADILSRLGIVALLSSACTIADGKLTALLGAEAKDGKLVLLSNFSSAENRLKKIEEAGTKALATLSATINGETKTFTGEDMVKVLSTVEDLKNKFAARETSEADSARGNIIKLFSVEGKVPKKADGTAYSADELKKLDVGVLQLLRANTPETVPLSARNRTSQTDSKTGSFKDAKGIVDLSAIFNSENAVAG